MDVLSVLGVAAGPSEGLSIRLKSSARAALAGARQLSANRQTLLGLWGGSLRPLHRPRAEGGPNAPVSYRPPIRQ